MKRLSLLILAAALAALFSLPFVTRAATIQVTTTYDDFFAPDSDPATDDPNDCSLREAIQNANDDAATYPDCPAGSGVDTITFNGNMTITLNAEISIASEIIIQGTATLDGGGTTRMLNVNAPSGNLRISDMTFQNGAETSGAAILAQGTLTCETSEFSNNTAEDVGGAIYSSGLLDIDECLFENNVAGDDGGAIAKIGAEPMTITDSAFIGNHAGDDPDDADGGNGGAIYASSASTITATYFSNNYTVGVTPDTGGGAIYFAGGSLDAMNIFASAFSGNYTEGEGIHGGAIFNNAGSIMAIEYSHFGTSPLPLAFVLGNLAPTPNETRGDNSDGGAIAALGETFILGSSFYENATTRNGGAISTYLSQVTIANSTISGNSAGANGGGVYNDRDDSNHQLINVTIADNTAAQGGGVYNNGDGDDLNDDFDDVEVHNTIIANNTGGNCAGGTLSDYGGNVVFPAGGCAVLSAVNGNPMLESPELTFSLPNIVTVVRPLGSGSSASGAGVASTCANFPILNLDQRGGAVTRPSGAPICDSGAYESDQAAPTPTQTNTSTPTNTMTATETNTATMTATASQTNTVTMTVTDSNTATMTATASQTNTATMTATASQTSTATMTPTASVTSTATATTTQTMTPTMTVTTDISVCDPLPPNELIGNGSFDAALTCWSTFGDITWQINPAGNIFEAYRNIPPFTDGREDPRPPPTAILLQNTGVALPQFAQVTIDAQIGNSSANRKRAILLAHNTTFTDLQLCSFWIEPGQSLLNYSMAFSNTQSWDSAWLSVYIEPPDGQGWLQLDNLSMRYDGLTGLRETTCTDPTIPAAGVDADSGNLLTNGDFSAGLEPWGVWDAITYQITGEIFEMYRNVNGTSALVLQNSGVAGVDGLRWEAQVSLGNTSGLRKRVLIMLHNSDFSDFHVCAFWLEGSAGLSTYTMRTFAQRNWDAGWLSVYVSPDDGVGWLQVDNAALIQRPALSPLVGTTCYYSGLPLPSVWMPLVEAAPIQPSLEPTATDAPLSSDTLPESSPVDVTATPSPEPDTEGGIGE